jgi:hypothetical protein
MHIALVLWRLYSRVKRFIGRQRSRLWRHDPLAPWAPKLTTYESSGTAANASAPAGPAA